MRVLIGSGKQDGYDEAQRMIAARLPGAGDEAAEWLDVLGQVPVDGLRGELVAPVRKFLDGAAGADVRRDLALARLDYAAAGEERRSALVREATGRWKDREAEALARFLLGLGLYQTLWETYPVEQVGGHTGVFPYLLQAIERGGAWERVIPLLDAHGSLIPKPEEMAHRAVAAHKTGDSPGQVRDWDSAMQEAKSSTLADVYLTLFRIAREGGLAEESDAAMVEAIRLGRGPLPLYVEVKQLLGSLARQGRENTLLEVCAIYLSFEPGNPVLITQYAYLACLNNLTEPKMILKAMEALAKGFPNELPIQCVLATVYLCDGQAAKAAETLESLKMSPDKLPPSYRATYLASQVLNGRLAKDDPSVTGFPWRSLLPSERKKFTDLIQSAP